MLTCMQIGKGLSVHAWPTGHSLDMEETIQFSQLQDVDCLIEKFPLEKANEAYGKWQERVSFQSNPDTDVRADAMLNGKVRFRSVLIMD